MNYSVPPLYNNFMLLNIPSNLADGAAQEGADEALATGVS